MSKEDVIVEEETQKMQIPSKYESESDILRFCAKLQYIDFEGRSDSRSLKNVMEHVAPKRLVLFS